MKILILGGDGMLGHESFGRCGTVTTCMRRCGSRSTPTAPTGMFTAETPSATWTSPTGPPGKTVVDRCRARRRSSTASASSSSGRTPSRRFRRSRSTRCCRTGCGRAVRERGARLIHFSTDCVFSGRKGRVPGERRARSAGSLRSNQAGGRGHRAARPDAADVDHRSGTRAAGPGWSSGSSRSAARFAASAAPSITRLDDARDGRLVRRAARTAPGRLHGVWHVASAPINKYDLLVELARSSSARDIEIVSGRRLRVRSQPAAPIDSIRRRATRRRRGMRCSTSWRARSGTRRGDVDARSGAHAPRHGYRGCANGFDRQADSGHRRHRIAGQVLVRRLLGRRAGVPRKVIVLSRDEAKQHEMRLSLPAPAGQHRRGHLPQLRTCSSSASATCASTPTSARAVRDADIVVNAAALKQVPTCEYFPEQAVLTNCVGRGQHRARHRRARLPVETVVGISTDKACKPVNVMGMTKAVAERIFIAANVLNPATRFVCVRYGNVLASRGSVIPLFHRADPPRRPGDGHRADTMTRFLLTLDQAVDTVFAALAQRRSPARSSSRSAPSATVDGHRAGADRRPRRSKFASSASGPARRCTRSWCRRRSAATPSGAATTTPSRRCCPSCARSRDRREAAQPRVQLRRRTWSTCKDDRRAAAREQADGRQVDPPTGELLR